MVEEDGTTTTKYVYGNELISAKTYEKSLEELKQEGEKNKKSGNQQADISYYYHYDNLKSTTLLTDETGNVVEIYDYGTYGEVTSGDITLTRFLYNGGLGVSSDSNGLYYMRARYYNPAIRRFINQDVETGSMDNSASLNRYTYVQGNPVSLTDPFGLSPDMEYGNYEANALKRLFKVADKVADYLSVVGTARDIKRSCNAFKNGNIADGIKHGATAALALAAPTAKVMKSAMKLAKNALKAEKCLSKIAQIASEGIKLAGKAVRRVGDAGKKVAKTVKNGVSAVARTVKKNVLEVYRSKIQNKWGRYKSGRNTGSRFPEDPEDLFPDNYPGLIKEVKADGKINYTVQAGEYEYIVEYHPKHGGDEHFDGAHYHVLKKIFNPKENRNVKFRLPNFDPDTPCVSSKYPQPRTFAPGDLLPTKNH